MNYHTNNSNYETSSSYTFVSYTNSGSNYSPRRQTIGCTCNGMGCKGTCRIVSPI